MVSLEDRVRTSPYAKVLESFSMFDKSRTKSRLDVYTNITREHNGRNQHSRSNTSPFRSASSFKRVKSGSTLKHLKHSPSSKEGYSEELT